MLSPNEVLNSSEMGLSKMMDLLQSNSMDQLNSLLGESFFEDNLKHEQNIISHISEFITKEIYTTKNEIFSFCEKVIYKLAEVRDPDESIFEFIEQAEDKDEMKFCVMLKALQTTLMRMPDKRRYNSINWCYQTICHFIEEMPAIEDFKLEGDEIILQETSDASENIEKIYEEVICFCKPFINLISLNPVNAGEHFEQFKSCSLIFIFKLLGRPLVYMNLESNDPKSGGRLIAEKLLKYIAKFKIDFMTFLNFVNPYKSGSANKLAGDIKENEYCNISLGVFFYLIYKENEHLDMISSVYHPHFIFEMISVITLDMLNIDHSRVRYKALVLCDMTLEPISEQTLDFFKKNGMPYGKLMEALAKLMIYSEIKEIRQLALKVFKSLLLKFDMASRYHIVLNIQNVMSQPGFIGFIVTIIKDFIFEALSEKDSVGSEYFGSERCIVLYKRICYLPDKEKSDLIELSDQIISSLNLLRFILIRDTENRTGIFEYIPQLEKDFLEPLQWGLQLSIAHYKLQQKDIDTCSSEKVSVRVAGEELPNLPKEQKNHVLNVALNTFDLIESLLARVRECIEEFKS